MCDLYDVDIRLVLAQGHLESHFATRGTAAKTNSMFNIGAYDGHSASKQIKNGFGYVDPNYSIMSAASRRLVGRIPNKPFNYKIKSLL